MVEIAKNAHKKGAKEIHIVSAHNPNVGLDWYIDIFHKIKSAIPEIHIKALTSAANKFFS